jgi:uncharacterized protein (TIGR00266 family)
MDVHLHCKPSYTMAVIVMDHGEGLQVERGAMVAMSTGVEVGPGIGSGGVRKAVLRRAFGGETFFTGRYIAAVDQSWVSVAPPYPGDLTTLDMTGDDACLITQGAFVAAADTVNIDVRYTGIRSVLLKEGISMLRVSGVGPTVVGSYGGIMAYRLRAGEEMIVDSAHIVGLDESVEISVGLLGSVVTAGITGEGLVANLRGPGRVWIQTRSEKAFGSWLFPDQWQNERGRRS